MRRLWLDQRLQLNRGDREHAPTATAKSRKRSRHRPAPLPAARSGGSDRGSIPEIAGPRAEILADMAVLLADHRHEPVKIEAVDDATNPDNDRIATGALLPGPHATLAGPTFEEWLGRTP
jgi:hypothetical protein